MPEPVLIIKNLSKTFPGQKALNSVSLEVLAGEVHALVGQNGSGKSTLVKCLSGFYENDHNPSTEITVDNRNLRLPVSLASASSSGIAFVHQDLGLILNMTVLENICLGTQFKTGIGYKICWAEEEDRVNKLMAEFGRKISPRELVRNLSSADRAILAIVRALDMSGHGKVLVLDEPTAALPQNEVEYMFDYIREIAAKGVGIIYISHRLKEVFSITNRVSVLKDGECIGTFPIDRLDERKLISLITGKELDVSYAANKSVKKTGEELLKVEKLTGDKVREVSFNIKRGEVVGLAGLIGSGCSEVGRILFGAKNRTGGKIWFKGEEIVKQNPSEAMKRGIAMVTDDRKQEGLFLKMSIRENMTITDLKRLCNKMGGISDKKEQTEVRQLISKYNVKSTGENQLIYTLSGGNQQKSIIAKWMRINPDLLICDEPVQGVDVGSKAEIFKIIRKVAEEGSAVIMISTDFQDAAYLCDRVLIMNRGEIYGQLEGDNLTESEIARLANFDRPEKEKSNPGQAV